MELTDQLARLRAGETVRGGSQLHECLHMLSQQAMRITAAMNTGYHTPAELREMFAALIGKPVDEDFGLFPPFFTDCGKNITLGKGVFINSGCRFQDQGGITIGDGALFGHNVVLATLNHDFAPSRRSTMHPAPIYIGKNVWIGANATVVPGVSIGDGAIVAAGAVVTRDVPKNTIFAGVPAKKLRQLYEEELQDA